MKRSALTFTLLLFVLLAGLLATGCSATDSGAAPGGDTHGATSTPAVEPGSATADEQANPGSATEETAMGETAIGETTAEEKATFAAGCFWCVEAVLEQLDGVSDVDSGYMGGTVENPTYKQVCSGTSGHAEVVQVTFDPAKISYAELLDWFWQLHDPTTLNRQGADIGTQYRSAIFYHSPEQRVLAEKSKLEADASGEFGAPIVTEITEAGTYYSAGEDHQDYYRANREQGYCRMVIRPKLRKLGLQD